MNEIGKKTITNYCRRTSLFSTHRKNTDKKLSRHQRKKLYLKLKARLITQLRIGNLFAQPDIRDYFPLPRPTTQRGYYGGKKYLCMNSVWLSVLKCFQFGMSSWAECLFLKELMNQSSRQRNQIKVAATPSNFRFDSCTWQRRMSLFLSVFCDKDQKMRIQNLLAFLCLAWTAAKSCKKKLTRQTHI